MYRPPKSHLAWLDESENMLEKASSEDKELIFLGDLNFDMSKNPNRKWLDLTADFSLKQLVNKPTRVSSASSSIIDLLYKSHPERITEILLPHYCISDHYPICFTRKLNNKDLTDKFNVHKTITYRYLGKFD